ncbi:MAG: 6-carboxytetrahydropterin synthase [Chthonomonadales bacterium]|nr:6-carboxytetrahydropterin synthase [Chthonomonadales bacterium]
MYTLIVRASFEAAHWIPGHPGKCARMHGHSYRVEAEFVGTELNEIGMVHDFADLRRVLDEIVPDHCVLNDVMDEPSTAENLAAWLYQRLVDAGLPVAAVTVWETERYGCRYQRDAESAPRRSV